MKHMHSFKFAPILQAVKAMKCQVGLDTKGCENGIESSMPLWMHSLSNSKTERTNSRRTKCGRNSYHITKHIKTIGNLHVSYNNSDAWCNFCTRSPPWTSWTKNRQHNWSKKVTWRQCYLLSTKLQESSSPRIDHCSLTNLRKRRVNDSRSKGCNRKSFPDNIAYISSNYTLLRCQW